MGIDTLDLRIKNLAKLKKVNLKEVFVDYDRMNKGEVSQDHFSRGLRQAFDKFWVELSVSDMEFAALCEAYAGESPDKVKWRDFCDDMDTDGDDSRMNTPRNPEEWNKLTQMNIKDAEKNRGASQYLTKLADNVANEANSQMQNAKETVENQLRDKVAATEALVKDLTDTLNATNTSIKNLTNCKEQLKQNLFAKKHPLAVVTKRLEIRDQRPAREKIQDEFQTALQTQFATLEDCKRQLGSSIVECNETLQFLLQDHQALSSNLADKEESLQLDQQALGLEKATPNTSVTAKQDVNGYVQVKQQIGAGNEMARQMSTAEMIDRAKQTQSMAASLIKDSERCMARTTQMQDETTATTEKFMKQKVNDASGLRSKLTNEIQSTENEINNLKNARESMINALQDKENPLAVAEKRLNIRDQKPDTENITDDVTEMLMAEVNNLKTAVKELQTEIAAIDRRLEELEALHAKLTADFNDKEAELGLNEQCKSAQDMQQENFDGMTSRLLTSRTLAGGGRVMVDAFSDTGKLLNELKTLASKDRIDVLEKFQDFDRYRHFRVSKDNFVKGLNLAYPKFKFTDQQIDSLCDSFAASGNAEMVQYKLFADQVAPQ